ncbi:MAG: hypothetical protein WAM14_26210 [Candidatus Nitrosopolaris sp.]
MAEETEREEIKEETHELEDQEQDEIEEIESEEFEPGIKEPQKEVPVVDDQQLNVLPGNEVEEEILLTTAAVTKKPKKPLPTARSFPGNRQQDEISSLYMRTHLERQTTQLNKIIIMLQSIQKDSRSTNGQSKLIKQLQSQLKQLQNQLTQIQKIITKKGFAIRATPSRENMRVLASRKRLKKKRK